MSHFDTLWACTILDLLERVPGRPSGDGLTDVVGELHFDAPVAIAELESLEQSCAWCFETYRVRLARVVLARDRKRAILLFRAPDAESVRLACRWANERRSRQGAPSETLDAPITKERT